MSPREGGGEVEGPEAVHSRRTGHRAARPQGGLQAGSWLRGWRLSPDRAAGLASGENPSQLAGPPCCALTGLASQRVWGLFSSGCESSGTRATGLTSPTSPASREPLPEPSQAGGKGCRTGSWEDTAQPPQKQKATGKRDAAGLGEAAGTPKRGRHGGQVRC